MVPFLACIQYAPCGLKVLDEQILFVFSLDLSAASVAGLSEIRAGNTNHQDKD